MAMTMKRLGPALGTTAYALRASLTGAGLLDPADKRPTRLAHALGCCFYLERWKDGESLRFPGWNKEALLEAVPALSPTRDDLLRSFTNRWAAADAMRAAAVEMREMAPALAGDLEMFAADATKDHIDGLTQAAARMAWARDALTPARLRLAVAIEAVRANVDVTDQVERLDGALQWLSTPIRTRSAAIGRIEHAPAPAIDRDTRQYADSVSIGMTAHERRMVETGYTFNHLRPRDEDNEFVAAVMGPLSRLIDPDAGAAHQAAAALQPMRATKHRARHVVGTIATVAGGARIAAAHHADITGDRLTIQTDVAAFSMTDADDAVVEQDGKPWALAWLREFLSTQTAERP